MVGLISVKIQATPWVACTVTFVGWSGPWKFETKKQTMSTFPKCNITPEELPSEKERRLVFQPPSFRGYAAMLNFLPWPFLISCQTSQWPVMGYWSDDKENTTSTRNPVSWKLMLESWTKMCPPIDTAKWTEWVIIVEIFQ